MARSTLVFLVMGTVACLLCSASSADVPRMINYQGKLTTASGGCLNDTVQMTFSVYPDTLGSPADWSEIQNQVILKDGIFNILLGSVDSIPAAVFDGSIKYLGVQVESDPEMRPLKPMVSVAYAYRAGSVDGGGGGGGWVDDGIVVRLESSTDNVGIGTSGPAGKLDVTGQSIFRRGDGIQDKIILNPEDPNVAIELRSETSEGTPFIDFANDDVSDFDARIRLREDDLLAIEGASDVNLQVDGHLRVDKELLVGAEPSEDLDATRSYYTYKGSAASPYTYQGSALRARLTLGGNSTNPVGTGHGITSESVMLESGSSENEMTPLYLGCVAHEPCRLWGIDLSVHGPVSSQADLLQGLVNFVNNYNAASVPFKGVGTAIVTRPGAGGSATPEQQISQTYPLDAGLAIVGFSGTPDEAVKTQGFKTALQIGGDASGWMQAPLTSKLGTGILIQEVETAGIKFEDFLDGATPALSVDVPSVMEINEGDSLKWKLSQEGSGVDATLLLRDMTEPDEWWWGTSAGADKRLSFQKDRMVVMRDGSVGIGTESPAQRLDVAGTAQVTGFKMPTGAVNNYVLTSDASGVGTWQPTTGGADIDWSLNLSDGNDTTLTTGGAWGIARYGNTLYGNGDSTHINLGVACTTGTSGQNYKYCTVGGGHGNTANGSYATVGGGYFNTAGNEYATVGGGVGNTASGYLATVGGGLSNTAANSQATVGGGAGDTASGNYSTVPGGRSNKAAGDYSFAAGRRAKANHSGSFVWADNTNEDFASTGNNQFLIRASGNVGIGTAAPAAQLDVAGTVQMTGFKMPTDPSDGYVLTSDGSGVGTWQPLAVAGDNDWSFRVTDTADTTLATAGAWGIARHGNTLYGTYDSTHVNLGVACITGNSGEDNKYCTVGGGGGNTAGGWSATVGGGQNNTADGFYSCVSGGNNNSVSHAYATVGGGRNNVVGADDATVSGGWGNTASGDNATVGGGYDNTADYNSATVGGGSSNTARYNYAAVGGGIYNTAISVYATVGGGRADTASAAAATVGGGYHNIASGDSSTIGGGGNNTASGDAATVGGGTINAATADRATIGGGMANLSGDTAATVGGGSYNKAWGKYSVVAGGGGGGASDSNSALGAWASIGGGKSNTVSNDYSIIAGGQLNTASGNYSSIGGGQFNEAGNTGTAVGGGLGNYASGYIATIGGGNNNTASGRWSTIAGGVSNTANDTASAVGGGRNNKARGSYSVVAGGGGATDSDSNSARGDWSTVSGGRSNAASGDHAAVGGGQGNWASTDHSTVGGGKDNSAGNGFATVAGGLASSVGGAYGTISGGAYNRIAYACDYSAIPGGYADTLTLNADYSIGFGRSVYVDDGYHVTFFDGTWSGHLNLNRDHRDATPSSYPIRVGTHAFNGNGAYLTSGGVWTDISSRAKKENFQQLDGDQVLDKIESMPMTRWKFKGTEERHIGPVAEDFYRAFGCGTGIPEDDSTSIAALDLAGVSLVAVQELTRLIKEQQKEITALKAQVEVLQTGRR
jgi:hypothetical protein